MLKLNYLSTLADLLCLWSSPVHAEHLPCASRGGSILLLCPSLSVILGEA